MKNKTLFRSACVLLLLLGVILIGLDTYELVGRILFILGVIGGIFAAVKYNADKKNRASASRKDGNASFLLKLSAIMVGSFVVVYFATKFLI